MYYVYILSNRWHTVFYTGMTSDIRRRMFQHKKGVYKRSFTKRYNCTHLLYYEARESLDDALTREQVIKRLDRVYKKQLINAMNPGWIDLAEDWLA